MVNEKQKGVIYIYSDNGPGFMPTRATPRAAGYDIMATSDFSVKYGETFKMDSGLIIDASYIEEELAYFLVPRSSSGGANIRFANTIGLIEPHEFRGPEDKLRVDIEVRVDTGDPVSFKKGDRIGQIVFFEPKHYPHQYAGTSAHHPGGDSRGGFGSTGT